MQSELRLRIISGIIMAAVTLGATWVGGTVFELLSVAIAVLVYYEWSTITKLAERDFQGNAFGWLSQAVISALILFDGAHATLLVLAGFAAIAAIWVFVRGGTWWLPGGIVYAGLTGISLSAIRGEADIGLIAMIFIFAVVWATDILAYFTGRAIGGPAGWTDLPVAQARKIDRLLDACAVGPGTRLLEIGTGWGELALRAAAREAVVHSITLSEEQLALVV